MNRAQVGSNERRHGFSIPTLCLSHATLFLFCCSSSSTNTYMIIALPIVVKLCNLRNSCNNENCVAVTLLHTIPSNARGKQCKWRAGGGDAIDDILFTRLKAAIPIIFTGLLSVSHMGQISKHMQFLFVLEYTNTPKGCCCLVV